MAKESLLEHEGVPVPLNLAVTRADYEARTPVASCTAGLLALRRIRLAEVMAVDGTEGHRAEDGEEEALVSQAGEMSGHGRS